MHLAIGFAMISTLLGDTLQLVDKQDYSWKPQEPIQGNLAFDNSDSYVDVKTDADGNTRVISNDGAVLLEEDGTFVSEVVRSGEHICLHVRKGSPRANSSRGLLLCRRIGGRVYSCLITSTGKLTQTGEIYIFAHLDGFEYPEIRVTVGAHKKGEIGEYWNALLKLSHKKNREEPNRP